MNHTAARGTTGAERREDPKTQPSPTLVTPRHAIRPAQLTMWAKKGGYTRKREKKIQNFLPFDYREPRRPLLTRKTLTYLLTY